MILLVFETTFCIINIITGCYLPIVGTYWHTFQNIWFKKRVSIGCTLYYNEQGLSRFSRVLLRVPDLTQTIKSGQIITDNLPGARCKLWSMFLHQLQ